MTDFKDRMADYVPVNERVEAFYSRYPEGSIQSEIVELTASRVTVKAYAYRKPDDERPGIGHSSLDIPGSTPYTRGSEIENCETSAWGRAIAALGFEVKRGIASADEVRNKQPEQGSERGNRVGGSTPAMTRSAPVPRTKGEAQDLYAKALNDHHMSFAQGEAKAKALGIERGAASIEDMMRLIAALETPASGVPTAVQDGASEPARASGASTTPPSEGSDAATASAPVVPPGSEPAPAPTMDEILEATGGELVPPVPGSDAYRLLPSGKERAQAKAYWDKHPEPEPDETEQLRAALVGK